MTKTVSFHKHEVVGANKAKDMLERMEYATSEDRDVIVKLVRNHQFRFYEDTKDETIQKWMRNLGKTSKGAPLWRLQLILQLMDRNANDKNKGKPLITKEWNHLYSKCSEFERTLVYYEDLAVSKEDLYQLKVDINKHKEALNNMIAIVQADPTRNRRKYLLDYLRRNYGKRND